MIKIVSGKISKAQANPWDVDPEKEGLEPIGEEQYQPPQDPFEPVVPEDFALSQPPAPLMPEPEEIKPTIEYTVIPNAPLPDDGRIPMAPNQLIAEAEIPMPGTEIDEINKEADVRRKIDYSMSNPNPATGSPPFPLRIRYTTIDGNSLTERTIHPDYWYPARTTGRDILIAMDELSGDWRAFSIDNINEAMLQTNE